MIKPVISVLIFLAVPAVVLVMFIASLYRYFSAKNKNKKIPGTFSDSELRSRRTSLIVSFVIIGVLTAVAVGLVLLSYLAIAYM